jgi:outer membrane lipoprotein-sorting protein
MVRRTALKAAACVAVLSLLAYSSPAARAAEQTNAPEGKDAAVKALQALQKDVTSYTASGKSTITFGDRTFEQTLSVVAKAPGKYKETATSERAGNTVERVTVCDGKSVWLPVGRQGQISRIDRSAVAKALGIKDEDVKDMYLPRDPVDLANPFLALNADTIKYDGTQKMGDVDVYVFEGQSKWPARQRGDAEPYWPRQKFMISAKDGLLRSATTYNRDGDELRVVTYTDVKINPPVEDDVFAFKPPEGSAVEDATQTTIDEMKADMEAAKKAAQAAAQQPAAPAAQ